MFIWEVKRFCSLRSHRSLHLVSKLTRDVAFLTTTKLLMEALQRKLVFICNTMVIIIVFYLMQSMRSPNFQLSPICLLPSQHSVVVRIIETQRKCVLGDSGWRMAVVGHSFSSQELWDHYPLPLSLPTIPKPIGARPLAEMISSLRRRNKTKSEELGVMSDYES